MTLVTVVPKPKLSTARQEWQQQHRTNRVLDGLKQPAEKPGVFASYHHLLLCIVIPAGCVLAWIGLLDVLRFTAQVTGGH